MSFQSSTESLLFNSSRQNPDGNRLESSSTESLLNDNALSSSTQSLINQSVQELLSRLHFPDTLIVDSESPDSTVSPILVSPNSISAFPPETERSNYQNVPAIRMELSEEASPLLSLLYNRIQVFLLRNKLSLDFLRIYKRYVNCLLESGLNPLEDRYFHRLQNELSESYEFTPRMQEILDAFLINPQNLIMKLALFEHRKMGNLICRYFEKWEWNCEIRRSLNQLEGIWKEFLKRKYLLLWSKKRHIIVIDLPSQGEDFRHFNLVSSLFDRWLARIETTEARKGLADHYLMDHALQRVVKRMNHVADMGEQAGLRYDAVSKKAALKQWRLRARERHFTTRQVNFKRFFFSRAKLKLAFHEESEQRAAFTRRLLLMGSFFDDWRSRSYKEKERLNSLAVLERKFIKTKALKFLIRYYREKEQELVARRQLDCISRKLFFEKIWKTRFRERLHFYSFQKITEQRLLIKYSREWQTRFFSRIKASTFIGSQQLTRFFRTWQLETLLSRFISLSGKHIARALFLMWHDRLIAQKKVNHFQSDSLRQKYCRKWKEKFNVIKEADRKADVMYAVSSVSHSFYQWSQRVRIIAEMSDRYNIFIALRAISRLKRGISHMNEVHRFWEVSCRSPISKIVLLRFFRQWKEAAAARRSDKLELVLQVVEESVRLNDKRFYLQLWIQKTNFYQSECLTKAIQVYDRNLQLKCLLRINRKLEDIQVLSKIGDGLRTKSLSLYFFYRWRDQYDYVQELLVKLETENNKKNLALLLNYLNYWSMKILKLNRNAETVQIFRKRWDRATVRGLMLLWKNKAEDSPRKTELTRVRQQLPSNSGLVTPIRRSATKNNTIPGSEGVKRYRIEAMKTHYGRIRRAIPSPIKSSTTLNSLAKKKINSEVDAFTWNPRTIPPPRLSLERINKNLASKIDRINFERIPEARLDPFIDEGQSDPKVDTSFLEEEQDIEFDESPIRRM
ncbi:hypothetical protein HG536_0E04240 [Torulaspora globosa]|uniref:Spindle body associated protein C-terminal domain-containing protein n=1 Tax=Torulaspora globosa TaxID=48254 RepID=A0A7G3ZJ27_9SACH|nr:uncharacterized protein HG536_0E04240 [Torulaspora globosa]QLL33513.1 hypothetical protein HG536_0E04240 [Torulaspora globosa]